MAQGSLPPPPARSCAAWREAAEVIRTPRTIPPLRYRRDRAGNEVLVLAPLVDFRAGRGRQIEPGLLRPSQFWPLAWACAVAWVCWVVAFWRVVA